MRRDHGLDAWLRQFSRILALPQPLSPMPLFLLIRLNETRSELAAAG
jgi:hypothetical protein